MNIAAIIVGIDGWERYTLPLVQSIRQHEPACEIVVVDNDSKTPYPDLTWDEDGAAVIHTKRLCYSAAINTGHGFIAGYTGYDWVIVLSNDVLCTAPFAHILEQHGDGDVVGPLLKEVHGFHYIEGWAVFIPRVVWDSVGGWDERFLGSDWEDVAFSTAARQRGFGLVEDTRLPFTHLDQKQRYHIVEDFWGKDAHNRELFMREYAAKAVTA